MMFPKALALHNCQVFRVHHATPLNSEDETTTRNAGVADLDTAGKEDNEDRPIDSRLDDDTGTKHKTDDA